MSRLVHASALFAIDLMGRIGMWGWHRDSLIPRRSLGRRWGRFWLSVAIAWVSISLLNPALAVPMAGGIAEEFVVDTVPDFDLKQGKILFQQNCSVCHINGQNLIIPYKNLQYSTLETYRMNSIEAIAYQVRYGKNIMPAFGEALSQEQIHNLAAFVLQQSAQGW
jgi:cytochrome c6